MESYEKILARHKMLAEIDFAESRRAMQKDRVAKEAPDAPTKLCNKCEEILPLSEFKTDRGKKDGLSTICRCCTAKNRRCGTKAYTKSAKAEFAAQGEYVSDKERKRLRSQADFAIYGRTIHKHKYRYDNVHYVNELVAVNVTCPEHGDFSITPLKHKNEHGCPTCKKWYSPKRLHNIRIAEDRLEQAQEQWGRAFTDAEKASADKALRAAKELLELRNLPPT